MTPWFILSYPRSRTAWLATYLTHSGVVAFHEAWMLAKTAKQLRALMEERGDGPVVNVDCANWFFLKEIQGEFPEAKFIAIHRPYQDVAHSSRQSFGDGDYAALAANYDRVMKQPVTTEMTVEFDHWTEQVSLALWDRIADGRVMDRHWHRHLHRCLIELTPTAVKQECEAVRGGELLHVTRRMEGIWG